MLNANPPCMRRLLACALFALSGCGGSTSDDSALACPSPQTATQTVTFHFVPGAKAKYVAIEGHNCAPFVVSQGGRALLTTRPFECGCECAAPTYQTTRFVRSGDTFAWEATSLATCSEPLQCDTRTTTRGRYVAERVPPGSYRVSFVTYDALPAGCTDSGATIPCFGVSAPLTNPAVPSCRGDDYLTVDFVLPAQGNVQVDVPLP